MCAPRVRSAALLFGLMIVASGLQIDATQAAGRVALVIGNGTYQKVPALPNPPNDASDIAASFGRLGFSVRVLTNARFEDMRRGLIEFGREARGADMAVVFFAGHGMEIGGDNWLIPVDAELRNDTDAENEAISLRAVMLQVANANGLGLVILDACRNNPFAAKMTRSIRTRAVVSGLARTEPTDNVLVAYAAKDGTTANDGAGRNSPFTAALLNNLEKPGLEVTFMFRNVRDEVMGSTKREQQPFVYGSLSKEAIYLKSPPAAAAAAGTPVVAAPPDEMLWATIRESSVPALFEEFLRRFPSSARAPEARARLAEARTSAGGTPAPPRVALQTPAANAGASGSDMPQASGLFTAQDAQRVATLASQHQIPLPQFRINRPDAKIPADIRRFVGVWATKVAFGGGRGRQAMIIVTDIDADRRATGYWAFGPPTPTSFDQNPANSFAFAGRIDGDTLRFENRIATWVVKFTVGDNLNIAQQRKDGRTPTANLEAVWRLAERERSAAR